MNNLAELKRKNNYYLIDEKICSTKLIKIISDCV